MSIGGLEFQTEFEKQKNHIFLSLAFEKKKKYRESQNNIPKRSSKYDYQLAQFVNWKTRIIYFSTKIW